MPSCDGDTEDWVRDSRRPRRKVTLDPSLPKTFNFSFSFGTSSAVTFAFLLSFTCFGVTVANSSGSGEATFLVRVAVRILCSREERRRLKPFGEVSGITEAISVVRGGEMDVGTDDGIMLGLIRWRDGMLDDEALVEGRSAVAEAIDD